MTKTYRSPLVITGGCLAGTCVLLASLGCALGGPGKAGIPFEVIVVLMLATMGLCLVVLPIWSRLVVSSDSLTWRYNFRTRRASWADIQSIGTGPASTAAPLSCLRIELDGKPTSIMSVTGTRARVDSIARQIQAAHQEATTASTTGAGTQYQPQTGRQSVGAAIPSTRNS